MQINPSTSQQYYSSSVKLHRQANAIRKMQQINKNNLCNSIIANVTINLYSKRNNNTCKCLQLQYLLDNGCGATIVVSAFGQLKIVQLQQQQKEQSGMFYEWLAEHWYMVEKTYPHCYFLTFTNTPQVYFISIKTHNLIKKITPIMTYSDQCSLYAAVLRFCKAQNG